MNIIDLRKNLRDSNINQRTADRRQNPYPFGSPEWHEYIIKNGLERPSHDRRTILRRASDLRSVSETTRRERPYKRILLTPAEKKLLEDMYLSDLE
jgi:hypothetical protein